jgi:hypothetical protein
VALRIQTFSGASGGNVAYKAIAHPLTAARTSELLGRLATSGPVAVYDPLDLAEGFGQLHDVSRLELAAVLGQDLGMLGRTVLDRRVEPVTELPKHPDVRCVLVVAFEADRLIEHIGHLLPSGSEAISLDAVRLPPDLLTNPRRYLDPLNYATNFAFFRDAAGLHTRLVTFNYWAAYGAAHTSLWVCLFDDAGEALARWREELPPAPASLVIDSQDIRRRFGLPEFTGQLFLHVVGAAGHDVVKYALDVYGDSGSVLSSTHDANAWPADLYAGLPAPRRGERVVLWIQNSHPRPIPPGEVGLAVMGTTDVRWLEREVPAFGTYGLSVRDLLPDTEWPQQVEIHAGRHMVRPRYEVIPTNGRPHIAHVNVERTDLSVDQELADLAGLLGKGFILPAPVLPRDRWRTVLLPTPMATDQDELPIAALVYDASGREVARHRFGRLPRSHRVALDVDAVLDGAEGDLDGGFGHVELIYDFADGGRADGWLHALFRYEDRRSGHAAETSFGSHVFNTVLTYGNEPQSYHGRPPGLSTRLFLRLGPAPWDTMCHLIYPMSTPWHPHSQTDLILHDQAGQEVTRRRVTIPGGGSLFWRFREMFAAAAREAEGGYVVVRDPTCRLFGYQGLLGGDTAFSLDHMFGS